MSRLLKRSLFVVLALLALVIVVPSIYLQFHPVPVTSARVLLNSILGKTVAAPAPEQLQSRLQLPPGFSVSVYAADLPMARFLRFTAAGDLLVSRPRAGEVVLLEPDLDGDGRSDGRRVLLRGLDRPHGLDIADGWLYVGENTQVGRVRIDERRGRTDGDYAPVVSGLTGDGNHWTKTVRIGPDGFLYVAQGSTCNVCEEKDPRRATIMRFDRDGGNGRIYASGLRNSVGMDWAPWDQALYATDNGRDMLGDDFPPCELNRIEDGGFYGWPYINGFGVPDPAFAKGQGGEQQQQLMQRALNPAFGFAAHNAPLGMHFLRNARMPAGYERSALVALHGSWNRTQPDGYKVVSLHWDADGRIEQKDFLSGFERNGDIIGRPVDIAEGPDGALYISDDYVGVIYRVAYGETPGAARAALPAREPLPDAELAALAPELRHSLHGEGEQLYQRYRCASCHEAGRAGAMRTVRPLTRLSERYNSTDLAAFLAAPTPPMPLFPLSERDRQALAVYLLSQ